MAQKERILITVQTYPNPSSKHLETVCTGGINDKGEWRRLYPVPVRYLEDDQKFRTFDVIKCDLAPSVNDLRIESHKPDLITLEIEEDHLNLWSSRNEWILPTVCESIDEMKSQNRTLAPVAVDKIDDFYVEPDSENWSAAQLEKLKQFQLFSNNKPLEKIPLKFKIRWSDTSGVKHKSRFISWEVCQTWRKWRNNYDNVIEKMKDKWLTDKCGRDKDVYFFMGNYAKHPQHYAITGMYCPPKSETQNDTLW